MPGIKKGMKRILITLPESMLIELKASAKKAGMTVSKLIEFRNALISDSGITVFDTTAWHNYLQDKFKRRVDNAKTSENSSESKD